MPKALTTLERDVLDWLVEYVRRNTYQPSVREIGTEFGIKSTKTVSELLQSLADKGWVERDASRSRGVRLLGLDLGADVVSVPHIDVQESQSLDNPTESLSLDRRIAGPAGSFLTTVVDDSMIGEGIRDGDLVLVEPVPETDLIDGDLVLSMLDGGPAIRRLRRDGDRVLLRPGRSDLPVLAHPTDGARILGRIGAVVRRLRTDSPLGRTAPEPTEGAVPAP